MKLKRIGFTILLLSILLLSATYLYAARPDNSSAGPSLVLRKMASANTTRTLSNISNWSYWMYYNGKSANDPDGNSGGVYPRATAGAIYQDGFIWGGKYPLDDGTEQIRVGGQTYNIGTVPGWIDGEGASATRADVNDSRVRIYRIRPDWRTLTAAMVKQEAAEAYMVDPANVTEQMTDEIIAQYEADWYEWPADLGAPFVDKDGDGEYDPDVDEAGIANADQVVWFVCNDLDRSSALSLYGSEPIGIELQVTTWAYNQPNARLGQLIFKQYKMINKSGKQIDDMYVAQWCDPDVGESSDDFCGCDTTLSMGYAYNGTANDGDYSAFGLAPVAIGYDFFQGPLVDGVAGQDLNRNGVDDAQDYAVWDLGKVGPGKINLPMTGFSWFAAGSAISDPDLGEYSGTLQWYNMLRGYVPNIDVDDPTPWTIGNETGGTPTKFPMAGDPVSGTGDLDGTASYFDPGDRRIALCSGPFTFAPGDTQEVVVAVVGGSGSSHTASVTEMKKTDEVAQILFDGAFSGVPKAPASPNVTVRTAEDQVVLEWGSDLDAVAATEKTVTAGYSFEGYNVYQLPSSSSSKDQAVKIATYDLVNGVKSIYGIKFLSSYGDYVEVPVQQGEDTGIKRSIVIDKDYITGSKLYEGNTYYFAVTAYNYNPNPELIQDKTLESSLIAHAAIPQEPLPGDVVTEEYGNEYPLVHSAGTCDGSASYVVIDPMALTGHDYTVFFDQQHYYRDADGVWQETNYPDAVGKSLSKPADLTGTTVTAAAVYSEDVGTIDVVFTMDYYSGDGDWIDGFKLDFPSGTVINSSKAEGSYGNYAAYGQVCTNFPNGLVEGTSIFWGDSSRSTLGCIEGDMVFTVNINTPTLPLSVGYQVYDDNYAGNIVDAIGIVTISEIGYEFKTVKHWNVMDETLGEVVLDDQTIVNGVDVDLGTAEGNDAAGIIDGFRVSINASYDAPTDFTYYVEDQSPYAGIRYDPAKAYLYYSNGFHLPSSYGLPFMITSYAYQGWGSYGPTATAWDTYDYSADGGQHGTQDMNVLQNDIELRFTGEYDWDNAVTTAGGGLYVPIKEGTGSKAVIVGARNYDLDAHPDVNNPGDGSPFFIQVPFEVWDVDKNQQISMLIYDRINDPAGTDTMYAFNPYDRMYTWILEEDYNSTLSKTPTELSNSNFLTWNMVFWYANWEKGTTVSFKYDNPIQLGVDEFTFSTTAPVLSDKEAAIEAVKNINVFPNPFYAYNSLSTNMYDNYVTFTHLPTKATIRIFNLAGIEVRKLEKDNSSQFMQWDLKNGSNLPVGSGLYIAHIDLPDLGKEKVLKFVIVQNRQILEYY